MRQTQRVVQLVALAIALTGASQAWAEVATMPATLPATAPATQKANDASDKYTAVKKTRLDLTFDTTGVFTPVDAFEVRLKFRRYAGELVVLQAVAPGAKVRKADVLLAFRDEPLKRMIVTAQSEVAVRTAALAAIKAELELGKKSDDLAMTEATRSAKSAADRLAWFEKLDADQMKAAASLSVKMEHYYLENTSDELDQLKKMYKSEELTNVTADIVVKRTSRMLELQKEMASLTEGSAKKAVEFEVEEYHNQMIAMAARTQQTLAEFEAKQKHEAMVREAALAPAQVELDEAKEHLADLQHDMEQMNITSTIDGVVLYGGFTNKQWMPVEARLLAVDSRLGTQQNGVPAVLLTVYQPGMMAASLQVPESKLTLLPTSSKVKIVPAALAGVVYEGLSGEPDWTRPSGGSEQTFEVPLKLGAVDERIMPGFKASAVIPADLKDVLVVPTSAIVHGRVKVKAAEGDTPRDVVLGVTNGDLTQIISGVAEGDQVLTKGKP